MKRVIKVMVVFWLLLPLYAYMDTKLAENETTREIVVLTTPSNPTFFDVFLMFLKRNAFEVLIMTVGIFIGFREATKELQKHSEVRD